MNTNKNPLFISQPTSFSYKRKHIVSSYDTLRKTKQLFNTVGRSTTADFLDLNSFLNSSYLDPYFRDPVRNAENGQIISNTLYATNRIYQNLLDYLTNMYYWRYVTTPRKIKHKDDNANLTKKMDYREVYDLQVEITEGLNIEVSFPKLLLTIFKNGKVFLYTRKDNSSKSIATIILPDKYCKSTVMTQYGTNQIEFNFSFFDTVPSTPEQQKALFELFPPEFKELYDEWKGNKNGTNWVPLDPKFSTCIAMNDAGFPTFLSVFYDIIDYKNYKLNELDRNTNGLERLVIQEVDLAASNMELQELDELHESMAEVIDGNGNTLVTSPGKIHVEQIQEERSTENKILENAYKSIFDNAGFDNALFSGESVEALKASLNRDMRFVWGYVDQIVNFYNVALNNLFNFKDYQLSFKVLPISPYNEKEKLELYKSNAMIGIGIVDTMVATGIKQIDLESTLEMEEFLDLRERLIPLQSSYTQSSSTKGSENDKEDNKNSSDGNSNDSKVTEDDGKSSPKSTVDSGKAQPKESESKKTDEK